MKQDFKDACRSNAGMILSWVAVILWMALIFFLSSQAAEQSAQLSNGITEAIIRIIEKLAPNIKPDIGGISYFIRKNAHFTAYMVLGILASNALGRSRTSRRTEMNNNIFAFLICVVYAISDEVHQLFVPGRAGQVTDVLIDSAGALIGIAVFFIIRKLCSRKRGLSGKDI